jgi:hypothetical protein
MIYDHLISKNEYYNIGFKFYPKQLKHIVTQVKHYYSVTYL